MTYIYRLAGKDFKLAEEELNRLLNSQNIEEKPERNDKIAKTDSHPSQLKRLALTHEISKKISEVSSLEDIKPYNFEGSFAVRAEVLECEKDSKELERQIGDIINEENKPVDLEEPDKVLKPYISDQKILIGELVQEIDRGLFKKRKNQERPFSSPVSLDPVLARVLVNLSGVKPGEHVLDPFCGTGGILIEAGLCGVGVHGLDVKEEMISGAEENLENYGIINHDLNRGAVSEVKEIFDPEKISGIVTDLPYGKSSKTVGNPVKEFLNLVEEFEGTVVFVWNEDTLGGYEADFSVYVHSSMTRYIFIID